MGEVTFKDLQVSKNQRGSEVAEVGEAGHNEGQGVTRRCRNKG